MTNDRLSVSAIDSKPVHVDRWTLDYEQDGESGNAEWWEVCEVDTSGYENLHLLSHNNRFVGLVHEGALIESWDEYEADVWPEDFDPDAEDAHESGFILCERDWDTVMDTDTYLHNGQGPMMSYWYPLHEQSSQWSRFSPADAAVKLGVSSMVVVQVGSEFGLALAGGGMDFSWQICEAFVRIGYLPPAHFADLPAMAERWHQSKADVYAAMVQTLTWQREQIDYRLTRLVERYGDKVVEL